jgi:hypothetical protein
MSDCEISGGIRKACVAAARPAAASVRGFSNMLIPAERVVQIDEIEKDDMGGKK